MQTQVGQKVFTINLYSQSKDISFFVDGQYSVYVPIHTGSSCFRKKVMRKNSAIGLNPTYEVCFICDSNFRVRTFNIEIV